MKGVVQRISGHHTLSLTHPYNQHPGPDWGVAQL